MNESNLLVCSMIFRDDSYGLGALLNSLLRAGFSGDVEVGYDGESPSWLSGTAETASTNGRKIYSLADGRIRLRMTYIDPREFYGNVKPSFLLENHVAAKANGLDGVVYFDPDIVLKCSWRFIERWMSRGVCLVEDVNSYMPDDHPRRRDWTDLTAELGLGSVRSLSRYFNSGFIGIPANAGAFLENWVKIVAKVDERYDAKSERELGTLEHPFYKHDQDCMNAAAMVTNVPLSTLGPEGMDFAPGGFVMSHAIGSKKPWRKVFLMESLRGVPPTPTDRSFWSHAAAPLAVYPTWRVQLNRATLGLAAAIGRAYRRRGT